MDDAFHYALKPVPGGGSTWSTRVVLQEPQEQEELVAAVGATLAAQGQTLTAAQIESCGAAILRQIVSQARRSRRTRRLFGVANFNPSCGGVLTDTDTPPTPATLRVSLNLTLTEEGEDFYFADMSFVREAVEGIKEPEITSVLRTSDDLPKRYTPGGGFRILGRNFGKKPDLSGSSTFGVYAVPVGGGAALRVTVYTGWTDREITGAWPSGMSGSFFVRVVTTTTIRASGAASTGRRSYRENSTAVGLPRRSTEASLPATNVISGTNGTPDCRGGGSQLPPSRRIHGNDAAIWWQ